MRHSAIGSYGFGWTPDLAALPSPSLRRPGLSTAICHRDALALTRKGYVDYVEATGEDLVVEAEVEAEVVMSEGDEFIAAMRTQPDLNDSVLMRSAFKPALDGHLARPVALPQRMNPSTRACTRWRASSRWTCPPTVAVAIT